MSCHIALSLSSCEWVGCACDGDGDGECRARACESLMRAKTESLMHSEVFPTIVHCNAAHRINTCRRRRHRRVSFAVVAFCGISILFCTPTVSCRLTLRIPYVWHVCLLIWKFVSVLSRCTVCALCASLQWEQPARARSVSCHEYVMKDCTIRFVVHIAPSNKKFPFARSSSAGSLRVCVIWVLDFERASIPTYKSSAHMCAKRNEADNNEKNIYIWDDTKQQNEWQILKVRIENGKNAD